MARTLFNFLSDIFQKKTPWKDIPSEDRKKFSPYMINRFISMDRDYTEIINAFQKYTLGVMSKAMVYEFYRHLMPNVKFYSKYIKAKKKKGALKDSLIEFFAQREMWSEKEAQENLKIILSQEGGKESVIEFLETHGFSRKEIKSKFGV